ncbi:phosphotransferase family protein [Cellulomonas gilvus]|uniref:Aminoglycoside phosphotransferase n=1 Tax=Cellulomonas gilvus (strain ATCC 13127 / NRRL B-14078) TaxID=593907 RepID=F8A7W4_CELGA|nr:phosphotransferase [Cellulomonas gilvus]AEI13647.1 aminoglycoside phosphotransferase [Cellulomonas gilvus ATCC 13127]
MHDETTPSPRAAVPHRGTASRPRWHALPDAVRAAVESRAGAAVLDAASQDGGFTEGFASRLRLGDGRRLFVKAASASRGEHAHHAYRHEAVVAAVLPTSVPAPRLLWSLDVGDWVVLAFEDVEATAPHRPWRPDELAAVLAALGDLAEVLTPAPGALLPLGTTADLDPELSFWRRCAAGDADAALVPAPWRARIDELAALEGRWAQAAAGDSAVHFDLRDDNILLADDGRVLVCDWNWVQLAAPWVDLIGLLISVHGDGLDAEHVVATHALTRDVPHASIDAFLVALAGYFVGAAASPPVPTSPWLRVHQAWARDAGLDWLAARLAR